MTLYLKKWHYKKQTIQELASQCFSVRESTDLKRIGPVQRFKVWEDACLEEEDLQKHKGEIKIWQGKENVHLCIQTRGTLPLIPGGGGLMPGGIPIGAPRPGGIPIGGPMGGRMPGGGPIIPAAEGDVNLNQPTLSWKPAIYVVCAFQSSLP